MKSLFWSAPFFNFFLLNLIVVTACLGLLLLLLNGSQNAFPIKIFLTVIPAALLIITLQYYFLSLAQNWFYKFLIFYLSMVCFLFVFGMIQNWNEAASGFAARSWQARLFSGFLISIFGQIYGLMALPVIVAVNYIFRHSLFIAR